MLTSEKMKKLHTQKRLQIDDSIAKTQAHRISIRTRRSNEIKVQIFRAQLSKIPTSRVLLKTRTVFQTKMLSHAVSRHRTPPLHVFRRKARMLLVKQLNRWKLIRLFNLVTRCSRCRLHKDSDRLRLHQLSCTKRRTKNPEKKRSKASLMTENAMKRI